MEFGRRTPLGIRSQLGRGKKQGIEKGILTLRDDGAIIGHGHPDKWFDAVSTESK